MVKVYGVVMNANRLYAATEEGLKTATTENTNLADYRNWNRLSGSNGLPEGACRQVLKVQDRIIVQKEDSLFVLNGSQWSLFFKSDYKIIHASASGGKIVLAQQQPGSDSRVVVLNPDGSVNKVLLEPGKIIDPRQAIINGDDAWVADMVNGLLKFSGNNITRYQPNSPGSVGGGEMVVQNGSLWVASGNVSSTFTNNYQINGLFEFRENEWTNYNGTSYPVFDSLYDLVALAVDPADNTIWAGSFGGGLLRFKPGKTITTFNRNSGLLPSQADTGRYQVSGLALDVDRNVWVANYGAAPNLAVLKPDNTWKNFMAPFAHTGNAVAQIVIDDYNQKWIISPNGNGLFCFNHGSTIDNPGDDRWKYFRSGTGNGNLPNNNVLCIAKDKNGFIWVGTEKGIGIIQCAQNLFSVQACEAVLPIVQQDNFAGYLFRDEQVQAIAVDGADRKWIGTKNGVWLISADGEKTIFHFKQENSPLLGNDVKRIAIDDKTGEVFFATSNGICSYRSTATGAGTTNENVLVFPNPVSPGYTGTIAIKGLVNNAIVKITELDGRLVYQTRATGGQAVWNGLDYRGRKISTGVYLVLVNDDAGKEKLVTKIVFISR
jgi:ligand-binding sensor domain-containing protein